MIRDLKRELKRAEELHPTWKPGAVHQIAILVEEAGECLQAALNYVDHGGSKDSIYKELTHTGAMVLRVAKHFKEMRR